MGLKPRAFGFKKPPTG